MGYELESGTGYDHTAVGPLGQEFEDANKKGATPVQKAAQKFWTAYNDDKAPLIPTIVAVVESAQHAVLDDVKALAEISQTLRDDKLLNGHTKLHAQTIDEHISRLETLENAQSVAAGVSDYRPGLD